MTIKERVVRWGHLKAKVRRPGFVMLNGRTIGSEASGASERSNADTVDLFCHLWHQFPELEVSGGRGQSAEQDFGQHKLISLPTWSGHLMALQSP